MLLAVEVVMSFTPLGFLRIGLLSVTMLHIPVIICAMALGKKYGAALGIRHGLLLILQRDLLPDDHQLLLHPVSSPWAAWKETGPAC